MLGHGFADRHSHFGRHWEFIGDSAYSVGSKQFAHLNILLIISEVQGSGFGVEGSGVRFLVPGSGFKVQG
jgi:hypothetical protein